MKICLSCLNVVNDDECKACSKKNVVTYEKNKIIFEDKKYSKKQWYIYLEHFLPRRNPKSINISYLKEKYVENCSKYTKLALILPSVVFFILFLLSLLGAILLKGNVKFEVSGSKENIVLFMYFLSLLYFVVSLGLFYIWKVKEKKAFVRKRFSQVGVEIISKEKYLQRLDEFDRALGGKK